MASPWEPPPKQPTTAPGHGLTRFGLPYKKRGASPRLLHRCPPSILHPPHPISSLPSLPFPPTHAIIIIPLPPPHSNGARGGETKKINRVPGAAGPSTLRRGSGQAALRTGPSLRPLPVLPRKARLDRLCQRAAFPVKQESGFVFADSSVSVPLGST